MSAKLNKALMKDFIGRSESLEMKGKARDRALLDFTAGAYAALSRAGKTAEAEHLGRVGMLLLATRGFSEAKKIAEKADEELAD